MTRLPLLAAAVLMLLLACTGTAAGATRVVDDDGGAGVDYTTIQAAVDAASEGDTIEVRGGTYVENMDVGKRITLAGEGADMVNVRAEYAEDHVFEVRADWVNISGFTVAGATYGSGIQLINANRCSIFDNAASNNDCGIYLDRSSNNTLTKNNCSNNRLGIHLDDLSNNNTLTCNNCSDNYLGIYLDGSSNNILTKNTFANDGLFVASYYHHNIIEDNTVNGKPLIYLEEVTDYAITNAGQVILVNCNNITVEYLDLSTASVGVELWGTDNSMIVNNNCLNNSYGILLDYSSNNNTITGNNCSYAGDGIVLHDSSNNMLTGNNCSDNDLGIYLGGSSSNMLTDNTASNNYDGIRLYDSSNNTLTSNTADSNNWYGIYLSGSSNNTLTGNNASWNDNGICMDDSNDNTLASNAASNNNYGIWLYLSSNNTLYHNNLADNIFHNAYDTNTNQWDNGAKGNYYSDYTGVDNNTDGIGDTPYPIPGGGGSTDRFPLMHPWTGDTSLKGDLNHDNRITPADAAIALRLAATGAHDPVADVSGDDRVTSLDALMILQAAAE